MASIRQWVSGARPRTLPAALAPVIAGTATAYAVGKHDLGLALLALIVAVALQVGVNYSNDYSDGIRGTDDERLGPVRLVGQGLTEPFNVQFAAVLSFVVAGVAGLALIALTQTWVFLLLGAASVWAAWNYTGGDSPYGYRGLGEIYVFVFFGLVATLGTMYTQAHQISALSVLAAIAMGSLASAILVANNLRDIPTDITSGKNTLAVRLGDIRTRGLFAGLIGAALVCAGLMAIITPWAGLAAAGLLIALPGLVAVGRGAQGRDLIPALATTGLAELAYAALLAYGLTR